MDDESQQLELLEKQGLKHSVQYENETARRCKSRAHAIVLCAEISGLRPKQIYEHLGLSQGTWSKIMDWDRPPGEKSGLLDPDLVMPLMVRCNNYVPIRYDVGLIAHELIPVKTTLEAELEATKAELEEERRVNRRLVELVRGGTR